MNRNLIAFRNSLVEAPSATATADVTYATVMSLQAELMKLGYVMTQEACEALMFSSKEHLKQLHTDIVNQARADKSATVKYQPFWRNFPSDVMEMDVLDMYVAAILHYWSNGRWEPTQELKERGYAFENVTFKQLELAKDGWLEEVARNLATFSKPLDAANLSDLVSIIKANPGIELPPITVRETMASAVAAGAKIKAKNPVDVLRVAVALSGGDVSLSKLPDPTAAYNKGRGYNYTAQQEAIQERDAQKFKKFSRAERRMLLSMLEELPEIDTGEMARHLGRWKRLGEVLHPGVFADRYPKAFFAFQELRNEKVRTFAGRVDLAFKQSAETGMNVLAERPGEFARKLDWLLRGNPASLVLPAFEKIAGRVSSKVLFEMFDHFEGRLKEQPRMVMLKGSGSKSKVLENLPALPVKTVEAVQNLVKNTLLNKAAKLPAMGNVYIDEELRKMPVPYSMQSSSEGANTFVRGTRFKLTEGANTLRGFCHWYDQDGQIDLDLSAQFLDKDFVHQASVAFYDLNISVMRAWHSGDVRHRVGHCAEYIDFNIDDAIAAGMRYVLFSVYNYNGNPMGSVPQASFGVMDRSAPQSNEIFNPATAQQAIKMQAKSTSCFPVLIDLQEREYLWIDMEQNGGRTFHGSGDMLAKLQALTNNIKFSVADLLKLHVQARGGKLVTNPLEADEVFMSTDFVRSYTKLAPYIAL